MKLYTKRCKHTKANEFFGVFGQALVGVNFHAYRLQHIDHHRCASNKEDPDAHIYMKVMSIRPGLPLFFIPGLWHIYRDFDQDSPKGFRRLWNREEYQTRCCIPHEERFFLCHLAQLSLMGIFLSLYWWAALLFGLCPRG